VTEEGGVDSHGAILATELGIPAVIGAKGATKILSDGQKVTLDAKRGVVYVGQ